MGKDRRQIRSVPTNKRRIPRRRSKLVDVSSSTLQYGVAGLLGLAWLWMLGRPLLLSVMRRSRRNSIGYFRQQQAALAAAGDYPEVPLSLWERRPRPMARWWNQRPERRRLQMLLGSALATFSTLLLAIALKGMFWFLFVVAIICFAMYVSFATYVGAARLRHHEAQVRVRRRAVVSAERERRSLIAQSIIDQSSPADGELGLFEQQSLFGETETEETVPVEANEEPDAGDEAEDWVVVDDEVDAEGWSGDGWSENEPADSGDDWAEDADEDADQIQHADATWDDQAWKEGAERESCLLYTSPSPRDATLSRMPSSA